MAQTQTTQTPEARQKRLRWVKVRYYVGANTTLYFYMPDGAVERILISGQKWAEPVINYVKAKGKHRVVKRRGFSHALRMYNIYSNNVWVAKIAPRKLLHMITSSPTWQRSEHARRIVETLSKL
jgi:hypothetical protein